MVVANTDASEETNQPAVKDTVIRAVPNQQITHILANYNISLNNQNKSAAAAGPKSDSDIKNSEN